MRKSVYFFVLLFLLSCARPLSWPVDTDNTGPFIYGPPTNINFQLSSNIPGADAAHTLMFDIKQGDLETYQTAITYPSEFTFNGFLAIGPAGTQIGSYSVDFDFDGIVDFIIPVISIDNNNAFADREPNGTFNNLIDSTLVYSNSSGNHVFTTTLPFGGDGDAQTIKGPFTERITSVINSGILKNPLTAGIYTSTGIFTSVDPDTDGSDNGTGNQPLILNFTQNFVIASEIMAVPTQQQTFPTYSPIASPVFSTDPAQANPISVGSVAEGENAFSVHIGLNQFPSSVDIYGAYISSTDPTTINVLNPDNASFSFFTVNDIINALSTGIAPAGSQPWKANTTGPVGVHLFDIIISTLPSGTYNAYLLVTPAGNLLIYYLWETFFVIP